MRNNQAMLSNVLDLVKSTESYVPLGNHNSFQKSWQEDIEHIIKETVEETDESVNSIVDFIGDVYELFLKHATNPPWNSMTKAERLAKVESLKARPQIEQRSEEWYKNFQHVLTASEFSGLFNNNKKRRDLVNSKALCNYEESTGYRTACPTDEMSAFGWGIRFEPVVKQIFELENKCKIFESGRIRHSINTSLAASPDGIIEYAEDFHLVGRLIEIKCPYSRKIGGEIPLEYWIQMQIQMEVTDVDECEYIEVEILSRKPKQDITLDLSQCTIRGTCWLFKEIVEEDMPFTYKYLYSPLGTDAEQPYLEGYECLERIPWGLKAYHRKLVQRDRIWYKSTIPWQEQFWNDVESQKKNPVYIVSKEECMIMDD